MNNVFGINQNPQETKVEVTDAEARAAFAKYVNDILDFYVKGFIDVVSFGHVDYMGVPSADVGPFPDGLANDVLALGMAMKREAKGECRGAHDRVQNEA